MAQNVETARNVLSGKGFSDKDINEIIEGGLVGFGAGGAMAVPSNAGAIARGAKTTASTALGAADKVLDKAAEVSRPPEKAIPTF